MSVGGGARTMKIKLAAESDVDKAARESASALESMGSRIDKMSAGSNAALDKIAKALDKLGSAVDKMGGDIARGTKEGESGFDKLGKSAKGMSDTVGKEIDKTDGLMSKLGGKMQQSGSNAFGKLKGVAATGVGALTGAIAFAATQGVEKMNLPGQLEAKLGVASDVAGRLGDVAGKIYASNFGDSLATVSTSVTEVTRNIAPIGTIGEAAFTKANEAALTLQSTFDVELSESTAAVGKLIKTGLVSDAQQGFDLVTVAYQKIPQAADDAMDTITEYSTQFRALGLTGQQALGLISQGMMAGARDTDTVADALKEFQLLGASSTSTAVEGFKALGLNARQMQQNIAAGGPLAAAALDTTLDKLRGMKNPAERAAAATALFGTKAEDLQAALLALDPSSAVGALGNVDGAAQRASNSISTGPAAAVESAKRKFMDWAQTTAGNLLPKLQEFGSWLSTTFGPIITGLTEALGGQDNALKLIVFTVGGLAAAYVLMTVGIGAYNVIMGIATVAQWAWNAAMSANPIGLVILAVVALVTAFVVLWNKSEGFRNFFIGIWNAIKEAIGAVVQWIVDKWNWLMEGFRITGEKFSEFGRAMGEGIKNGFKSAINWIVDRLNWVIGLANTVLDGLNYIPGVNIPHIPNIPHMARGGTVMSGGLVEVGERGREIVALPGGAQVMNNDLSDKLGAGATHVTVIIDGREVRAIVREEVSSMAGDAKRRGGMRPGGSI